MPLEERTASAKTRKADLFVSLHANRNEDKKYGDWRPFILMWQLWQLTPRP
ncbi:MAG: N-acetylmuramoyl-L-alanine amidase [Deltaproteobacteria bacterium]|nr:N-acetylmuramoyl-L-alanine amidase [Deltaproteobacteria bacterium]MBW1920739.1 N-acetylmuramoyl-L-alanine amidase [Deltaproteobacteria bacterium]MBW1934942.1 N-acetylmuramoyl-L-alanine amidase [Deltaproteobacteria bacterium]MBW1977170.1 N-acetylmuramoyl-L-alanine amidase [Deltaproteobacteria bacterium]MBW2045596.1 N-acetylmuramoyl-L-alanine amidase [Deltaproteobacteria bacterium]